MHLLSLMLLSYLLSPIPSIVVTSASFTSLLTKSFTSLLARFIVFVLSMLGLTSASASSSPPAMKFFKSCVLPIKKFPSIFLMCVFGFASIEKYLHSSSFSINVFGTCCPSSFSTSATLFRSSSCVCDFVTFSNISGVKLNNFTLSVISLPYWFVIVYDPSLLRFIVPPFLLASSSLSLSTFLCNHNACPSGVCLRIMLNACTDLPASVPASATALITFCNFTASPVLL